MDSITLDSGTEVAEGDEFALAEHDDSVGLEAGTTLSVVDVVSVGDGVQVDFDTEDGPLTLSGGELDALLADETVYRR